MLILLHNKMMR